ncbi:DUF945 family protein [Campylobacter mucosalis]|uniref:DUF945 family protein n=1 Tax=Campylobacter mucosalis TaxID=202 RepID=UPI00147066A5|nr:DUF945 family protein [Campylobacter mucosalis]
MKKILFFLVLVGALALGGSYFAGKKAQEEYNKFVSYVEKELNLKIENKKYTSGLFESEGSFDLKISQADVLAKFGYEDTEPSGDELKLNLDTKISHSPLSFVSGFKSSTNVKVVNEDMQDTLKKAIGSNVIASVDMIATLDEKKDFKIKFADVNFKEDGKNVKTESINFEVLAAQNSIKTFKSSIKNINLDDSEFAIDIKNLSYDLEYKEPVSLNDFSYIKLFSYPYKNDIKVDTFIIKEADSIKFDDFKYSENSSWIDEAKGLMASDGEYSTKTLEINGIKLKELLLKTSMKNMSMKSYEKLINATYSDDMELSISGLREFFSFKPRFDITKFSLKNESGNELNFSSNAFVEGDIAQNADIFSILGTLRFDAKLHINTNFAEFFKGLENAENIEASLLEMGVIKPDENKGFVSYMKFDPSKYMDIMINDKIGLISLILGQ